MEKEDEIYLQDFILQIETMLREIFIARIEKKNNELKISFLNGSKFTVKVNKRT